MPNQTPNAKFEASLQERLTAQEEQGKIACDILKDQRNNAQNESANAYLQLNIVSRQLAACNKELQETRAQLGAALQEKEELKEQLKKSEPPAQDSVEGANPPSNGDINAVSPST